MQRFIGLSDLTTTVTYRAVFAEFISTFIFIFVGCGSVVSTAGSAFHDARLISIALAHGFAIAVLVYATADISGGHVNPAVTCAAIVTRKISLLKGLLYILAQLTGAGTGAYWLKMLTPASLIGEGAGALGGQAVNYNLITAGQAIGIEVTLTFLLVFTVFATAIDPRGSGDLAPLAIGLSVLIEHFVGVPLTGASMNPARSFGPAFAMGVWQDHWIYWIGPICGAILAGGLYQLAFLHREVHKDKLHQATLTRPDVRPAHSTHYKHADRDQGAQDAEEGAEGLIK